MRILVLQTFLSLSATTAAFQVQQQAINTGTLQVSTRARALQRTLTLLPSTSISNTTTRHIGTSRLFATTSSDSETEISWKTRIKCWRPTIQDVERISFGKPAKKKGTGSRGTPHRLNEEERKLFDQARRKGFLEIGGSGWRSQRRDAPLVNTYRSLCDARGQACIALHKGNTGEDELVIDLSPLRLPDTFETVERDMIEFVGIPTSYRASEEDVQDLLDESEIEIVGNDNSDDDLDNAYDSRPIYQLPTHCVSWNVQRSDGKALGKKLAMQFKTIEANASKSKKPKHVKPGKNRRSGGYGIG